MLARLTIIIAGPAIVAAAFLMTFVRHQREAFRAATWEAEVEISEMARSWKSGKFPNEDKD